MICTITRCYKNTRRCSAAISEKILSIPSKSIINKMKYLLPKRQRTNSKRAKSKLISPRLNISDYPTLIDLCLQYMLTYDIIYQFQQWRPIRNQIWEMSLSSTITQSQQEQTKHKQSKILQHNLLITCSLLLILLFKRKQKKLQLLKFCLKNNKFMISRSQSFIFSYPNLLLSFPEVVNYLKQKNRLNGKNFRRRKV